MKMVRFPVSVPATIKKQLDELRTQGYSIAGFVRSAIEKALNQAPAAGRKGR